MTKTEFFKKFGQIALDIAKIQIPAISAVEMAVKKFKSGQDKKQAVIDTIMAAPDIIESIQQKDILNQELFKTGVSKVNDGMVDILNSIKKPDQGSI